MKATLYELTDWEGIIEFFSEIASISMLLDIMTFKKSNFFPMEFVFKYAAIGLLRFSSLKYFRVALGPYVSAISIFTESQGFVKFTIFNNYKNRRYLQWSFDSGSRSFTNVCCKDAIALLIQMQFAPIQMFSG